MAGSSVTGSRLKAEKLSEGIIFIVFQSPAQNYNETRVSLGDLVYLLHYSTYLMRSDSSR